VILKAALQRGFFFVLMTEKLFSLAGRRALVTGASAGLGRNFASVLAAAGATVVLTGRRTPELEKTAQTIHSAGGEASVIPMDVTDERTVATAFDHAEDTFGCVDVLVNNSGIAHGELALEIENEDWDRVIDTNLRGAWLVAREAGKRLVRAGQPGSIINIASILGLRALKAVTPYAVSKAGLIQMTRTLALEWAQHSIRVNAIAPGFIMTDMNRAFFGTEFGARMVKRIPMRRVGEPGELDGALMLLASDASSYMTGSVITVDGGHLQSTL
jgi:NAD(P)-dependent dehydrogenase (short-subunit alcohol dehydrogenase family)